MDKINEKTAFELVEEAAEVMEAHKICEEAFEVYIEASKAKTKALRAFVKAKTSYQRIFADALREYDRLPPKPPCESSYMPQLVESIQRLAESVSRLTPLS